MNCSLPPTPYVVISKDWLLKHYGWVYIIIIIAHFLKFLWILFLQIRNKNRLGKLREENYYENLFDPWPTYCPNISIVYKKLTDELFQSNIQILEAYLRFICIILSAIFIRYIWDLSCYASSSMISRSVFFAFFIQTANQIVVGIPIKMGLRNNGYNKVQSLCKLFKELFGIIAWASLSSLPPAFIIIGIINLGKLTENVVNFNLGFVYLGFLLCLISICVSMFSSIFIKCRQQPFPNGFLKQDILKLAEKSNFPVHQIVTFKLPFVDGNNAFFTTFCCFKRVVILEGLMFEEKNISGQQFTNFKLSRSSQLIKKLKDMIGFSSNLHGFLNDSLSRRSKGMDNEQLLGVVAHELGHWKHKHVLKGYIMKTLILIATVCLMSILYHYDHIFAPLGFKDINPPVACIWIIHYIILSPINDIAFLISKMLSHSWELDADRYATVEMGKGCELASGLKWFYSTQPSTIAKDKLHNVWYDRHPSLDRRLSTISKHCWWKI